MDPTTLTSSSRLWPNSTKRLQTAITLYNIKPFEKINEGDIFSIIVYGDERKVSGRAEIDAYTGKILRADKTPFDYSKLPIDYGKLLKDIVKDKMKPEDDPKKEDVDPGKDNNSDLENKLMKRLLIS